MDAVKTYGLWAMIVITAISIAGWVTATLDDSVAYSEDCGSSLHLDLVIVGQGRLEPDYVLVDKDQCDQRLIEELGSILLLSYQHGIRAGVTQAADDSDKTWIDAIEFARTDVTFSLCSKFKEPEKSFCEDDADDFAGRIWDSFLRQSGRCASPNPPVYCSFQPKWAE